MSNYDYLTADAAQPTAKLTTDFVGEIYEAFDTLSITRNGAFHAADATASAKIDLDTAEREAIVRGVAGNNAEQRAANLAKEIAPLAGNYRDAKRNQAVEELKLQHAADHVRMLQMILDAHKVGVVLTVSPGTTPDDLLDAGLSAFGLI